MFIMEKFEIKQGKIHFRFERKDRPDADPLDVTTGSRLQVLEICIWIASGVGVLQMLFIISGPVSIQRDYKVSYLVPGRTS